MSLDIHNADRGLASNDDNGYIEPSLDYTVNQFSSPLANQTMSRESALTLLAYIPAECAS